MIVLKNIISYLNLPPFEKKLTYSKFNSIYEANLIPLLSEVFSKINEDYQVAENNSDDLSSRFLAHLKLYCYPFINEREILDKLLDGIIKNNKDTLLELLEWLLKNFTSLKEIVYLSKFKVDIPSFLGPDFNINPLIQEHQELTKRLMFLYRENIKIPSDDDCNNLKSDIKKMNNEKSNILKQIKFLNEKLDKMENSQEMLNSAKKNMMVRKRENDLLTILNERENTIFGLDNQLKQLEEDYLNLKRYMNDKKPLEIFRNQVDEIRETVLVKHPIRTSQLNILLEECEKMFMLKISWNYFVEVKEELCRLQCILSGKIDMIQKQETISNVKEENLLQKKIKRLNEEINEFNFIFQSKKNSNTEKANIEQNLVEYMKHIKYTEELLSELQDEEKELRELLEDTRHILKQNNGVTEEMLIKKKRQYEQAKTELETIKDQKSSRSKEMKEDGPKIPNNEYKNSDLEDQFHRKTIIDKKMTIVNENIKDLNAIIDIKKKYLSKSNFSVCKENHLIMIVPDCENSLKR